MQTILKIRNNIFFVEKENFIHQQVRCKTHHQLAGK